MLSDIRKSQDDVHNDYEIQEKELGRGQFGVAKLAKSKKDGKMWACKIINKGKLRFKEDIEDIRREIQILNHLNGHKNIVGINGSYEDDEDVYIILELCTGGELFDRIVNSPNGHFSERDAAKMIRSMLEVAAFCHDMGVIHRDIKPENFLMDSTSPNAEMKCNDFGLSVFFKPGQFFSELVGSIYYISPEVVARKHAEKSDVWSIGVICYILLCGYPPYAGAEDKETFNAITHDPVPFHEDPWPKISKAAKECITMMLVKDPARRVSAKEALKHPWIWQDGVAPTTNLGDGVLTRMRKFADQNKFKKRAMMMIARNMPAAQIEGLKKLFEAIDEDKSGTITIAELNKAMQQKGQFLNMVELEELMKSADVDGDGTINYDEFLAATLHVSKLEEEEILLKTFKQMDKDGSGDLDSDEVLLCLRECIPDISLEAAKKMIAEVDDNGDGKVSYDEFVKMLRAEQQNKDVNQDFEVQEKELGRGQFGVAKLAKSKKDGKMYACKIISKRKLKYKEDIEDIRREIQILNHLNGHKNIVGISGSYEDENDVYILLELCSGGELFDRIVNSPNGHFSERDASRLIRRMLEVASFCHDMGVIHRDIKPENFLMDSTVTDAELKCNDFGLSVFFKPGQIFTELVGSSYYIAPEVIARKHAEKSDVWSIGVICYILLCGYPPFAGADDKETFHSIVHDPVPFHEDPWPKVSKAAKECISMMLVKDPARRATAKEALKHPWIWQDGVAPATNLGDGVLTRMRKFADQNKFKKRAMMMIARNMPAAQIEGLKKLFEAIDEDKSGTITIAELNKAMKEKGQFLKAEELEELLKSADVDGDGTINYDEFLAATLHASKLEQEDLLLKTFKQMDKDGSGDLDSDEVLLCLRECIPDISLEAAKKMIAEVDSNKDGKVQYNEFVNMIRSEAQQKAFV